MSSSQSTSELRRLYVLARARLASFEVEVAERLAPRGRAMTELLARDQDLAAQKVVSRAREGRRGLRRQGRAPARRVAGFDRVRDGRVTDARR